MNKWTEESTALLKSMLGIQGYESLEKAIYHQSTQAISDPLEYYLPLLVVPRAILSWLVQHIKPMPLGSHKEIKFPGRDEIMIYITKSGTDQYRAEFVSGGKVIHSFDKQSLPAFSGHLMTVGEIYEPFADSSTESPLSPVNESESPPSGEKVPQSPQAFDMVRHMMSISNIAPKADSESVKWEMSHANVRELTGVIGKLIDAFTAKQISRDSLESELDKVAEKEVPDRQGKLETSTTPEEKYKEDMKAQKKNLKTDSKDEPMPKPKITPESKARVDEPSKQSLPTKLNKEVMSTSCAPAKSYFKKKMEVLQKPNGSELSPVIKDEKKMDKAEMPKGAGQPVGPKPPQMPKPPVPAGNNPAASATKQAQSSGSGKQTMPHTPGAPLPKNPSSAGKPPTPPTSGMPKPPSMKMGKAAVDEKGSTADYFRNKLHKPITKSYNATEEQLYKSNCLDCGKPEFTKGRNNHPVFTPCACFLVLKKDEEGFPVDFVKTIRKSDGSYGLEFNKNTDPEMLKVFWLTLKSQWLLKKKYGL